MRGPYGKRKDWVVHGSEIKNGEAAGCKFIMYKYVSID
jgi:hypothetical protein